MYHSKSSYAGVTVADPTYAPIGLNLPAIAGYHGFGNPAAAVPTMKASPPEPPSGGPVPMQGQPVEINKGTALLIGGLVVAGLGIVGYFAYQELQLRKRIVEQGGGEALMKYELGKAAGTAAAGLFASPSAKPNRRKRRAKRTRSRRRS